MSDQKKHNFKIGNDKLFNLLNSKTCYKWNINKKLAYNNVEPKTEARITSFAKPINFFKIFELNMAKKSTADLLANNALKLIIGCLLLQFGNN